MSPVVAPVAQCEDYDSDASVARPETRVQARREATTTSSRRPPSTSRPVVVDRSSRRDVKSDSGVVQPPQLPQGQHTVVVTRRSSSKSKPPVIHRVDSHHDGSKSRAPPSRTPSRLSTHGCHDPNCGRADCASSRNSERRYTLPQKYSVPYSATPQPQPVQHQRTQQPQYNYPQDAVTLTVPNVSNVRPRPRTGSMARARPLSFSGYPVGYQPYGPPPAVSSYYHQSPAYYPQYQQLYQQPAGYLGSAPPGPATGYPTQAPVAGSPSSPTYPTTSGPPRTYSARQVQPTFSGYELTKPLSQNALQRTISARQAVPSARHMPGTFPDPESSPSESDTDSEEERRERHRERERDQRRRSRARDKELMPPPRRPSIKTRYISEPSMPSSVREPLRRNLHSDPDLEYPSSSDYVDSDRTARAVIDRRTPHTTAHYPSNRSRRPSISTTASSGRTKATASNSSGYVSTAPSSAQSHSHKVIVEDRYGRRAAYLSKEAQADLIRRIEAEKFQDRLDLEDRVEAYQRQVRGANSRILDEPELTAENIRRAQVLQQQQHSQPSQQQRRPSATGSKSHVTARTRNSESHASSTTKSKATGSTAGAGSEGIKIQSGDTVLHVYGDAKIEMRAGEDGGPAQFIIGSGPPPRSNSEATSSEGGSEASSERGAVTNTSPTKSHSTYSSAKGSTGKNASNAERTRRVRRSLPL